MPHCEACDRFYNPNTLLPDGSCPSCGRVIAEPAAGDAEAVSAPWHFKVVVAVTVAYLGFRLLQLVVWLVQDL